MSNIPKKVYNCIHCNRFYSRKSAYEKHVLCCEILSNNPKEHQLKLQEIDDAPPNIVKLYDIIKELVYKQAKQEKEIESLKQFISKTKKRLSVIDWLNENCKKNITFNSFMKNIKIERKHLDYIFKYDFIDGLMYTFQEILPLSGELPIRCFDQKPGTFFIVKNDNWVVMTGMEYEEMLDTINRMIIVEFGEWQEENRDKIIKDTKFNDIYEENIIKVLGTKRPKGITYNRIKNKLYGYLKFNLKRIIQFEFN
jgi:hypothetical protein